MNAQKMEVPTQEGISLQCGNYVGKFFSKPGEEFSEILLIKFSKEILKRIYEKDLPQLFQTVRKKEVKTRHIKNTAALARYVEGLLFYLENPDLAIEELLKGPNHEESVQGYYSEIPKGTRLLGVTEENGQVHINLSRQFVTGGGSNSQKQRAEELKRTILGMANGIEVMVEIEGEKLSALLGEGLEIPNPLEQPIQ